MDLATFSVSLLIGSIIGQAAATFLPRQRHDARALMLLVAICGSIGCGWLLAQAGAPGLLVFLGNLILVGVITGAITSSLRRSSPNAHR
jgi:hypothetical protein